MGKQVIENGATDFAEDPALGEDWWAKEKGAAVVMVALTSLSKHTTGTINRQAPCSPQPW
jgi:hypothetical protein